MDDINGCAKQMIDRCLERNNAIIWRDVQPLLLNFCLAMHSFELPTYMLLWIFDWLPGMHYVNEFKKESLIDNV